MGSVDDSIASRCNSIDRSSEAWWTITVQGTTTFKLTEGFEPFPYAGKTNYVFTRNAQGVYTELVHLDKGDTHLYPLLRTGVTIEEQSPDRRHHGIQDAPR
jgi:hypothetical protein